MLEIEERARPAGDVAALAGSLMHGARLSLYASSGEMSPN